MSAVVSSTMSGLWSTTHCPMPIELQRSIKLQIHWFYWSLF